jgi:hypothetical protein
LCNGPTGRSTPGRKRSLRHRRRLGLDSILKENRPALPFFLSPSRELDPSLISDNQTNRLEQHHPANPKKRLPCRSSSLRSRFRPRFLIQAGCCVRSSTSTVPLVSVQSHDGRTTNRLVQRATRLRAQRAARDMKKPGRRPRCPGRRSLISIRARRKIPRVAAAWE